MSIEVYDTNFEEGVGPFACVCTYINLWTSQQIQLLRTDRRGT